MDEPPADLPGNLPLSLGAVRHCTAHPQIPALGSCERCGDFVCGECRSSAGLCAPCDQRQTRLPWLDREAIGIFRAYFRTLMLSITEPRRFVRAVASAPSGLEAGAYGMLASSMGVIAGSSMLGLLVGVAVQLTKPANGPANHWWFPLLLVAIYTVIGLVGAAAGSLAWAVVLRMSTASLSIKLSLGSLWRLAMYAAGPFVVGWVPFLGLAAMAYSIVLTVVGVSEQGDTSAPRAAAAVLLPLAIAFMLAVGLYLAFLYFALRPR